MQVVEDITTGNSIKELTKEILKSKITKEQLDDYLENKNKNMKQNKNTNVQQNEQEISQ